MSLSRLLAWWVEAAIIAAALIILAGLPVARIVAAGFLVLLAIGWQLARWLGLRFSDPASRLLIALGLSLTLAPVVVYWTGLALGFHLLPATLALAGVGLLLGVLARIRPPASPATLAPLFTARRHWLLFAGLLAVLAAIVAIPYVQVTQRGTLIEPTMSDWYKHYTVTWLIEQTGLPPKNLLYPPWRDRPFVYYYFFHITVATLRLLSGGALSVLATFAIATVATALLLAGLVAVLARRLLKRERTALLAPLFVSVVGGLDLLPLLPTAISRVVGPGGSLLSPFLLEGGLNCRDGRILNIYSFYIWAPHHAAAGVAFVLGVTLFSALGRSRRLIALLPFLLLAVIGHSVYVAVPVFSALGLYALWDIFTQRRSAPAALGRTLAGWLAVAAGFVIVGFPPLRDLSATSGAETSGLMLYISRVGATWQEGAIFTQILGDHWLTRLLDAPLHYLIDMGLPLVLGLLGAYLYVRQRRAAARRLAGNGSDEATSASDRAALWLLALAAVLALSMSVLITSRGAVLQFTCNDFRMRALLPASIALACFAGLALETILAKWRRPLALVLLVLLLGGVAGTARDFARHGLLRFVQGQGIPAEAMAAYDFARTHTPEDALFQGDMGRITLRDRPLHVYANRLSRIDAGIAPLLHVPAAILKPEVRTAVAGFATTSSQGAWASWRQLQVDYVFIGPEERAMYSDISDMSQFDDPRYFELVYDAFPYQIYRVLPEALP